MKTRLLPKILVTASALGVAWVTLIALRSRPASLLAESDRLGSILSLGPTIRATNCPWFWLSDHQIIVVRRGEGSIAIDRHTTTGATRADAVDVHTGRVGDLDPGMPSRMYAIERRYGPQEPDPLSVSPDGKTLLWKTSRYPSPGTEILSTTLNGTLLSVHTFPDDHDWPLQIMWKLDSSGWFRLRNGRLGARSLTEVDTAAGKERREIVFPERQVGGRYAALTRDGKLLLCNVWSVEGRQRLFCGMLDIEHPQATARTYSIDLPAAGRLADLAYSPASDRLAVLVKSEARPPRLQSTNRVWRWLQERLGMSSQQAQLELWTCGLDGSAANLVGVRTDVPRRGPPMGLERCSWSPDGKRVGYSYGSELYVVRVD